MGNEIAGLTPPPLISVEDCLSDLSGIVRFDGELLGSRLFKVAKAKRIQGGTSQLVVIKALPTPNATELLAAYAPLIAAYCRHITCGYNIVSFTVSASSTERNILLMRDFTDQSLVDRLCTRPFLCLNEKRWIAFQLLHAVQQLHSTPRSPAANTRGTGEDGSPLGVLCHGDIKAENVLLTSWGWVLLADPAPFKPCWLPADNPSEFTHYFDSSRRRVCYLAPERFVELKATESMNNIACSDETKPVILAIHDGHAVASDGENKSEPLGSQNINSVDDGDNTQGQPPGPVQSVNPATTTVDLPEGNSVPSQNTPIHTIKLPPQGFRNQTCVDVALQPSMDLFSLGCVLLELFTDGSVAFTLADLLAYRGKDSSRFVKLVEQVPCDDMKALIASLLSLDPDARGSADSHLAAQRGKAFPEVFYSQLLPYMQKFLSPCFRNPNVRIAYIRRTLPLLLKEVGNDHTDSLGQCALLMCNLVTSVLKPTGTSHVTQTPQTAASHESSGLKKQPIVVHEVMKSTRTTSTASHVQLAMIDDHRLVESGKIDALVCYLELSSHIPAHMLSDRVVPYCMDLTSAMHSTEVRSLALECLAQVLEQATMSSSKSCSHLEISFLTEYLYPTLAPLSVDPVDEIRVAYARCLPSLTSSTLRLLDKSALNPRCTASSNVNRPTVTLDSMIDAHDSHLAMLRTHVQDRFADLDRQVRYALMHTKGLAKLAQFFGRSRTSGTLLSHMITFLNDKNDHGLRTSFYRQIVPLILLIGVQSISVIRSLLEQGLIDPNETVIEVCLRSLTQLLSRRLLSAPIAVHFLRHCFALTAHPTGRIRQSAVGFIAVFARQGMPSKTNSQAGAFGEASILSSRATSLTGLSSPASVYARLANAETAKVFFRRPVRQCFTSDMVLLANLRPPVLRAVLDNLISLVRFQPNNRITDVMPLYQNSTALLDQFFQLLKEREASRAITRPDESPSYSSPGNELIAVLLTKLHSLGLTERMEAQLLHLAPLVRNCCDVALERSNRGAPGGANAKRTKCFPNHKSRVIDSQQVVSHALLLHKQSSKVLSENALQPEDLPLYLKKLAVLLQPAYINYEKQLQYNLLTGHLPITLTRPVNGQRWQLFGRDFIWSPTTVPSTAVGTEMGDFGQLSGGGNRSTSVSTPWAQPDFSTASSNLQSSMSSTEIRSSGANSNLVDNSALWPAGRPQGTLVAHLQEHRPGVMSLAVHPSGRLLASCSSGDGAVKLWNCGMWPVASDGYLNQSTYTNNNANSSNKASSVKTPGLTQIHALPTRSWWTYQTNSRIGGDATASCRNLVWTQNGASLITVAENQWLHRIDVATGRCCNTENLCAQPDRGHAVCLTASASTEFPACLNLSQSRLVSGGGDANVIAYATTSNHIVGRDLRIPFSSSPIWCLKQDRLSGLIRCLAMHSCHTWLISGTARGQLVSWDLRYHRPVASVQRHSQIQTAILDLQIAEVTGASQQTPGVTRRLTADDNGRKRTLIFASTDQSNGVTVWDLESCASAYSAALSGRNSIASPVSTPVTDGGLVAASRTKPITYSPVRSLFACPSLSLNQSDQRRNYIPPIISGGEDGHLRYWDFNMPSTCGLLVRGSGTSTGVNFTYTDHLIHGVRSVCETQEPTIAPMADSPQASTSPTSLLTKKSTSSSADLRRPIGRSHTTGMADSKRTESFPTEGRLELRETAVGHENIISDISLICPGQYLLVSASMDGVIKIWR